MRVGISGTRDGATLRQLQWLRRRLQELGATELHHGDCVGVDAQAHQLAVMLEIPIVVHPPKDERKRAFAEQAFGGRVLRMHEREEYLARNERIVEDTDVLLAMPAGPEAGRPRSGTWYTVRYATARRLWRADYVVEVCFPTGRVEVRRDG